ncbi:MAG: diguanylate cyclase [Bradyrhizobium sp.]|uniref:diguanylate cyclase n=1 Tax=Bradyrhizobium sp. TaxID=376 RepID=UPI00391ACD57
MLILDVDGFCHVNRAHGQDAGNAVLREVAEVLRETMRGTDVTGRPGAGAICRP